jgi:hypothetical protein
MLTTSFTKRRTIVVAVLLLLLLPGLATSLPTGIGGQQQNGADTIDDVAKEGCLCHNGVPANEVQIILDDVPYAWTAGETYELKLHIIGGPDAGGQYSAGFSMRVSSGTLSGIGADNWQGDLQSLTHTSGAAAESDRMWELTWVAPAEGEGTIAFWITGNSVNGDGGLGNQIEDMWNQLTFALTEGDEDSLARGTRTVFAGDGNVAPPEPESHGADLHHMGAKLRAHWLGLLGFGAVIMCVVFAGLMLRYGFSTSYEGRSNQLRLRYKLMRRGDQ